MLEKKNRNEFLIIGIGNPWEKYQRTRHNVGAWILDCFAKENNFPDFIFSEKFNFLNSEGELKEKKIILVKPQTFMNDSGQAVKRIIANYKLKIENFFVIHDDLDISLGKIKINQNCGSAGHKGVESIIRELKTKNFIRIRIGIKPENKVLNDLNIEKFVLKKFDKKEQEIIEQVAKKVEKAIKTILEQGLPHAMNVFNKK